ncbi:hypothetical protein Tco_0157385 [Tanacetum coccineum]
MKCLGSILLLMLLVYKLLLLVLKLNAASINVTTTERLRLLKEFLLCVLWLVFEAHVYAVIPQISFAAILPKVKRHVDKRIPTVFFLISIDPAATDNGKANIDDDQEATKMKELMEIVLDEEELSIDAIPLATKPPIFSAMLKSFDREDLETLWKLTVDVVWRNQLGKKVLIWKLIDSCGVHFVRMQDMHIYMLVEKRYPLKPSTIEAVLNRKLQADH